MRATFVVFAACGFALASFVSRIPQLRDNLNLSPARLGVVLLTAAGGSLVSRLFSRYVITKLGQRATVTVTSIVAAAGVAGIGLSHVVGLWGLVGGLLVLGLATSVWDVAMNVQAAGVERELGRSVMSRFHAAFSVGTVTGALVGVAMVAAGVGVLPHLVFAAIVTAVSVPLAARFYLPDQHDWTPDEPAAVTDSDRQPGRKSAWLEPRTLLIGLFVLAFAFGEGAANDWISVAVIDGYHAPAVLGTIAFTTFLVAVTAARWFGSGLLDKYGRVTVLRTSCATVIVGLLIFIFGHNVAVAFAGVILWGAGVAFGYPVGISAGADDPRYATGRVTVISTIGKFATFAGPPLIGLVGGHVTVLRALLIVAALQAVAVVIASATRPLRVSAPATPDALDAAAAAQAAR